MDDVLPLPPATLWHDARMRLLPECARWGLGSGAVDSESRSFNSQSWRGLTFFWKMKTLFEVYFELTEEDQDILDLILGSSLVIHLSYTVFEIDQSGISDINTDCFIIYLLNWTLPIVLAGLELIVPHSAGNKTSWEEGRLKCFEKLQNGTGCVLFALQRKNKKG